MSAPVQISKARTDNIQRQITTVVEEKIRTIVETADTNEANDTELKIRVDELEQKVNDLITYLKNWISVGNIRMDDIEEHLSSKSSN